MSSINGYTLNTLVPINGTATSGGLPPTPGVSNIGVQIIVPSGAPVLLVPAGPAAIIIPET